MEDNKTNQLIAKTILEQIGLSVVLTENGEEGADYYLSHQEEIDLILMDLHMPVLNGYEAAMKIRQQDTEVPIVAMTADAINGVEEECQKAGINHYISKPFNPDQFIKTILDLLELHSITASEDTRRKQPLQSEEKKEERVIKEEEALKLLGNNQQIYYMLLKEYYSENETTCELLEKELQNKNYSQQQEWSIR